MKWMLCHVMFHVKTNISLRLDTYITAGPNGLSPTPPPSPNPHNKLASASHRSLLAFSVRHAHANFKTFLFCLPPSPGFAKQEFYWEKYLKKCHAKAAPEHLFKEVYAQCRNGCRINILCLN